MRVKADDEGASHRIVFRIYKNRDPELFQAMSSYSTQSLNRLAASLLTQYFMTQRTALGGLPAASLPVQQPAVVSSQPVDAGLPAPRKEKAAAPRAPATPAVETPPAALVAEPPVPAAPAMTEPARPAATAQRAQRPVDAAPAAAEAAPAPVSRVELAPNAFRPEPVRPAAPPAPDKTSASRQRWLQTAT